VNGYQKKKTVDKCVGELFTTRVVRLNFSSNVEPSGDVLHLR